MMPITLVILLCSSRTLFKLLVSYLILSWSLCLSPSWLACVCKLPFIVCVAGPSWLLIILVPTATHIHTHHLQSGSLSYLAHNCSNLAKLAKLHAPSCSNLAKLSCWSWAAYCLLVGLPDVVSLVATYDVKCSQQQWRKYCHSGMTISSLRHCWRTIAAQHASSSCTNH